MIDGIVPHTRQDAEKEIEELEQQIARRFNIKSDVRATIIQMVRDGKMVEDELVADWHDAFTMLRDLDAPTYPPPASII